MLKYAIIAFLAASSAMAHEAPSGWEYPYWCCSGTDCSSIPMSAVKPVKGGYQITLRVGQHPMITKDGTWFISHDKVRVSPDDQAHICFFPTEDTLRCFFMPPMSF